MAYSVPALATFNLPMNRTSKPFQQPSFGVVFCCLLMLVLAACGQTGPLYLPDENGQEKVVDARTITEESAQDIEKSEDEIEEDDGSL